MDEEFKGNFPEIDISNVGGCRWTFTYRCTHTKQNLQWSCVARSILTEKCFDCIGFNTKFAEYFKRNNKCSCGKFIDFGYFMIIFLLEEAGFLPKDFKMICCYCYEEE